MRIQNVDRQAEANARLIAKAPEMLTLLRELASPQATMIDTGLDERQCGICEALQQDEPAVDDAPLVDVHDSDCLVIRTRALLRNIEAQRA